MKNKKGFTLIELLVAIVIIVSILALAVVSITKISDKKKEEAYKDEIEQIITAAASYYNNNKYKFSDLAENESAVLSIKELVNSDYVSSLTNPITGAKLDQCDYVKVTKNNGKVSFEYEAKNTDDCKLSNGILAKLIPTTTTNIAVNPPENTTTNATTDIPKLTLSSGGTKGSNNWYISGAYLKINVNGPGSYSVYLCTSKNNYTCNSFTKLDSSMYNFNNDGGSNKYLINDDSNLYYFVKVIGGDNPVEDNINIKYDNTRPVIKIAEASNEYLYPGETEYFKVPNGSYTIGRDSQAGSEYQTTICSQGICQSKEMKSDVAYQTKDCGIYLIEYDNSKLQSGVRYTLGYQTKYYDNLSGDGNKVYISVGNGNNYKEYDRVYNYFTLLEDSLNGFPESKNETKFWMYFFDEAGNKSVPIRLRIKIK